MSAKSRFSLAVLLLSAAALLAPGVSVADYAGNNEPTQVPTSSPPVCGPGKGLPYRCQSSKRADEYRLSGICPSQQPNGWTGIVVCQDPWLAPIAAAMQCWDYGNDFDCDGHPVASNQSLSYTWTVTGPLRVFQPNGNRDPSVNIACLRATGGGWVTLSVRTDGGATSSVTEYLSCL
jgi:hypothetical protein